MEDKNIFGNNLIENFAAVCDIDISLAKNIEINLMSFYDNFHNMMNEIKPDVVVILT